MISAQLVVASLLGWLQREQSEAIGYLREENRILKAQLGIRRLCETLVSWRLLVGGPSPGASHHSFTTSSEEPPLPNFNSQWDIPDGTVRSVSDLGGLLRYYHRTA